MKRKRGKKCCSVKRDVISNEHGTSASSDDGSPVDLFRELHLGSPQPLMEPPQLLVEVPQLLFVPKQLHVEPSQVLLQPPQPLLELPQSVVESLQLLSEAPRPLVEAPQPLVESPQPLLEPPESLLEVPEASMQPLLESLQSLSVSKQLHLALPQPGLEHPQPFMESPQLLLEPPQPHVELPQPLLEPPESLLEAPEACLPPTREVLQAPEVLLEPKHKIFLSHSGADKDFTWQLCEDLERVHHFPFFDKRKDCLPKGEKFPPLIIEAAKQCRVAILVLSDEFFTRSKWPMIELNEFVKAEKSNNSRLKILPLFLGLTMKQFQEEERQQNWLKKWQDMSLDDGRIIVKEWQHALSRILGGRNAMEYNGVGEGHVPFRKEVVEAVCKLVRPDVQWDVSHVQSMDMLSEPVLQRIKEIKPFEEQKVRVVGLYGMGGIGKTTVAHLVCNQMLGDFCGKACYVEFGSMKSVVMHKMRKTVLQELTEASPKILNGSLDQLAELLKKRMRLQKVFLALDNIWDYHIEEARMYLEIGYHAGSIVLVTSRSLAVLKSLGIHECDCLEMPELDEKGATDLFLHYSGRSKELPMDKDEKEFIKRCVKQCHFFKSWENVGSSKGREGIYQYLPLALKTLGRQFKNMSDDVLRWKILKKLEVDKINIKFNLVKSEKDLIFNVLRVGYDRLRPEEKYIFLDLALLLVPKQRFWEFSNGWFTLWTWICTLHRKREDEMLEAVNGLQRKGLLDKIDEGTELLFNIHDLYLDFAVEEARAGPFESRRFLIDKEEGISGPPELLKNPPGLCWSSLERIIIHNEKVQSLEKLHFCSNVEVLELFGCRKLEEVDVTGMGNLRSIEILECEKLSGGLVGIESLSNLVIFRGSSCGLDFLEGCSTVLDSKFVRNLSSLRALQTLQLQALIWSEDDIFPPNLSACTNLQELCLRYIRIQGSSFNRLDFGNLPRSLMKIDISYCHYLVGTSPISSLSSLTNLQFLNLSRFFDIIDFASLSELFHVQDLNISYSRISELPDFRNYKKLQVLDVSYCRKLTSIAGIVHATTLKRVDASGCRNLEELPDDLSGFEKLETLDLSDCLAICTLPEDYKGSARRGIIKVKRCWGLSVALVQELHHSIARQGWVWRNGKSMQSWIDAMRAVNCTTYDLLKQVVVESDVPWDIDSGGHWSYLLEDGEKDDFVVRALWEHGDMGGNETNRLSDVVAQLVSSFREYKIHPDWWAVVATAACTFEVVMERALLEPWDKTLLHYTIREILPHFLHSGRRYRHSWGHGKTNWLHRGIEVVLMKCKEQLKEASDRGIDKERTSEGLEVVGTLFRELRATEYGRSVSIDSKLKYYQNLYGLSRYCDIFPNFPFGQALALQVVDTVRLILF